MKKPLIVITGPTASGKSDTAIYLARKIGGEIISADSMQVYKQLNIGSAKITEEERKGVTHHLIDVLDPKEEFNVVAFKEMALAAMDEIYAKGHIPIIAGGTGFYVQALLYDVDFTETEKDTSKRDEYARIAKEKGNEFLHNLLREVDPKSADAIHCNNVVKVIRALEFYEFTGKCISEHNEEQHENVSPYNFEYFVLNDDRGALYERINKRVD